MSDDQIKSAGQMDDQVKVELNASGPDPNVWGDDADRPVSASDASAAEGMEIGEVRMADLESINMDELRAMSPGVKGSTKAELIQKIEENGQGTIKGPGEEWRKDETGGYVNR